jgi:hypothetical protein
MVSGILETRLMIWHFASLEQIPKRPLKSYGLTFNVFFLNRAAPASASKRSIRPSFISFIQQKTDEKPYNIIQTEVPTKHRCQSSHQASTT